VANNVGTECLAYEVEGCSFQFKSVQVASKGGPVKLLPMSELGRTQSCDNLATRLPVPSFRDFLPSLPLLQATHRA
jgi:hypothetical protein